VINYIIINNCLKVAEAIERKSDKLEVNDTKSKVRRLESLPDYDETTPSRTVVALNLPIERPTIESVAEIFSACGDIVLVIFLDDV
jgi:la-related protein 6